MKFFKIHILICLLIPALFCANIAFCYIERVGDFFPSRATEILSQEGHSVDLQGTWFVPDDSVNFTLYFLGGGGGSPDSVERALFRSWIHNGGKAFCFELGWFPWSDERNWDTFLADPEWRSEIGGMEIVYWPQPSSLPHYPGWSCYGYGPRHIPITRLYPPLRYAHLDTLYAFPRTRIVFADSSSAGREVGVLMRGDPVLAPGDSLGWIFGAYARYGSGTFNLFLSSASLFGSNRGIQEECGYPELLWLIDYGDNIQFVRNLFTTNDRADSVWLSATDSTFTVFLPHCTPFVAGSTSFSFESAAYGLWELRASDWCYWHTDSSITIQYPDSCPMGVPFEVCVNLVPDATGETVLPTGPVCDSFAFNYTGITETPTPQSFAISAYPNPFNSSVTISLDFGSESPKPLSTIEIFDVNGRRVSTLRPSATSLQKGGNDISPLTKGGQGGSYVWRPDESLGSGVYLVRIVQDGQTYTKPVVYVK